jgi:hypothetical protein
VCRLRGLSLPQTIGDEDERMFFHVEIALIPGHQLEAASKRHGGAARPQASNLVHLNIGTLTNYT